MREPCATKRLHVVYVSRLAVDADYRAFAAVCRTARQRNAELGVSGVLLFDGERFCQWLHGPPAVVERLLTTIAIDGRHTAMQILHHQLLPDAAPADVWRAGFVAPQAMDALEPSGLSVDDIMDTVAELIGVADLEPPVLQAATSAGPSSCAGGQFD